MMDIEKLIEDLRGLLKQYGEKIPYGELVGAPWPYSRAGDLVWQDPEPYFIEQAAIALSTLQDENEKLQAELELVKRERDVAINEVECTVERYIPLGPFDRLCELAQADLEGRCVVLPCKIFDKVWNIAGHYQFEVTEIDLLPYGNILFRCENKGTDDYAAFYGDDLGDTFSLEEPPERDNLADAEAALRREQE